VKVNARVLLSARIDLRVRFLLDSRDDDDQAVSSRCIEEKEGEQPIAGDESELSVVSRSRHAWNISRPGVGWPALWLTVMLSVT
jgi:hypothetical protein